MWRSWNVAYRDLWILDEANEVVSVINLTAENITQPDVYEAIKSELLDAAQ